MHVNYSIWGWVGASNNDPAQGLHALKSGLGVSSKRRSSTGLQTCQYGTAFRQSSQTTCYVNELTTQVGRLVGVIAAVVVIVASPTRRDAVLPCPGTARELISTARRCTHAQCKPSATVITSLLVGIQSRLVPSSHAN